MTIVTRFAPSPTGRLHIGHAYSALFGYKLARDAGGIFILRIEDIDEGRCRPEFEQGIYEDLRWLGLDWQTPVRRQSDYMDDYKEALHKLSELDLLYPCFCTRKEIQDEIARAASAPHGPEGALYPGTCRHLTEDQRAEHMRAGRAYAFRLDLQKAITLLKEKNSWPLAWYDAEQGVQVATPEILGDVVLARKDVSASYHLSVTVDDHLQGITVVTRGEDLFYASHLHRLLQELLGLDVPEWHHHKLLLDDEGKRFAKRNESVTLQHLRETEKKTPQDIMRMIGLSLCAALALFAARPARAQDSEPTVRHEIGAQIAKSPYRHYVTFSLENDSIGNGTDRNYTNGARISYLNIDAQPPAAIGKIAGLVPGFDSDSITGFFWTLGQNMYTPSDITVAEEQPDDRPWAAFLYGSAGLVSLTENHVDELELTLGVVGPAAQGEWAQKRVHDIIGADEPQGWDHQLKNEPGAIVSWRRRWPGTFDATLDGLYFSFEPNVNASVGNIYTYAGTGAIIRMTPFNDRFQDTPPFVRPAMPGTGYFETPEDGFGWYLYAGVDGRAVARNIFLDGNTFRDGPSVDKKPLVADLSAGLALTFERVRVSYSAVYRTKEFDGQDENDLFGGISLSYRY
jgi:glutamyl-Q tRNA(Asp) synthetase